MAHWTELLRNVAQAPDTRVDELALLNAGEREQMTLGWNETASAFGAFQSVADSFLCRATADPHAVALECGGVTWSYGKLAEYAQSLAAHLVQEGLEPGGLVGIAVERSAEMLGSVLAVMLAGGAYLPLDPRHPRERLEGILADAGVTLLLVSSDLSLRTSARLVQVRGETFSAVPARFQARIQYADSLAYVIYTSGSTGVPKGVAVEHGALVNLLRSMQQIPGLHANDTFLAITTLAFDIAGLELLLPLITGARLVIATDTEVQDGRLLLNRMERSGTTVLQATPGAWRLLMDAGWEGAKLGAHPPRALCGR